jgi:hypothetical protein
MAPSCPVRLLPGRIMVLLSDPVIFCLENRIMVLLKYSRKLQNGSFLLVSDELLRKTIK